MTDSTIDNKVGIDIYKTKQVKIKIGFNIPF